MNELARSYETKVVPMLTGALSYRHWTRLSAFLERAKIRL